MSEQTRSRNDGRGEERDRIAQEFAGRLRTRGVDVRANDSNDDITAMIEAVERFEARVLALGGDLMVDVPPAGHQGQPDQARFKLPLRRGGESAGVFVGRLAEATNVLAAQRAD